jgi:hypothetical protein
VRPGVKRALSTLGDWSGRRGSNRRHQASVFGHRAQPIGANWRSHSFTAPVQQSAPTNPSRSAHRARYHLARVRHLATANPRNRPPTLEHVRDLWTLHWMQSDCTAAIWRNDFGLELRVSSTGRRTVESRLSRYGEAPLLLIADDVKASLIAQGWIRR